MILSILVLLIGAPLFFFSLYKTSRTNFPRSLLWGLVGCLAFFASAAAMMDLAVPTFFSGAAG